MQHESTVHFFPEPCRYLRLFKWVVSVFQAILPACITFSLPLALDLGLAIISYHTQSFCTLGGRLTLRWWWICTLSSGRCASSTLRIGSTIEAFNFTAPAPAACDARSHLCGRLFTLDFRICRWVEFFLDSQYAIPPLVVAALTRSSMTWR